MNGSLQLPGARRLLVLDVSYSLEAIRANGIEASVTCRDLGGYFDRVWTVHPFASLVTSIASGARYGGPVASVLNERHVFVEGKVGRFAALRSLPPLNLLLSQVQLFLHLIRLIRRERVSVLRAGDPLLMGIYGWALSRICRIPLVIRLPANNDALRAQTKAPMMPRLLRAAIVERAIERFVLRRAQLVAAGNEDIRRWAVSRGAPSERSTLFRVGNLVDRIHFSDPAARHGAADALAEIGVGSRPFLLCIGRLEAVKMPDHPIRVLAQVRAAGYDVDLVMVGDGRSKEHLQALALELDVAARVKFAGSRHQEWLAAVIPAAAVVLSPITGRALCEVALGGAPVVAYDIDWQGELVQSGRTGALVPSGDIKAMAQATVQLLSDHRLAQSMGACLRDAALAMMDPQRLDDHERRAYDALIGGAA